jgi:hypothetical protein
VVREISKELRFNFSAVIYFQNVHVFFLLLQAMVCDYKNICKQLEFDIWIHITLVHIVVSLNLKTG